MFAKLTVTHLDGTTVEGEGINSDLIRFERQFGEPASSFFDSLEAKEMRTEWLWFFGWCAEKRTNPELPPFDEWIDTVELVSVGGSDAVPPTDPDGSPTP